MILGQVVGELWATRQADRVAGNKLLLVKPHSWFLPDHDVDHLVALDRLGAGIGEQVLVCLGAPGRWEHGGDMVPIEAAVMAIVDHWRIGEPGEQS